MKNIIITLGILMSITSNAWAMHGKALEKPESEEPLISIEEAWQRGRTDGENRLEQLKKCQEEKNHDEKHTCDTCKGANVSKELVQLQQDLQWWKDKEPGKDTDSDQIGN